MIILYQQVEAKVGYNVKKIFSEETLYMDRESQIKAIEKTFEDNKIPIEKHYSKPGVTPVEVLIFIDLQFRTGIPIGFTGGLLKKN